MNHEWIVVGDYTTLCICGCGGMRVSTQVRTDHPERAALMKNFDVEWVSHAEHEAMRATPLRNSAHE